MAGIIDDSCHKLPKEEKKKEQEEEEKVEKKKSTHQEGWLFRMKKTRKAATDLTVKGLSWLGDRVERQFQATHPSWHVDNLEPSQRIRRTEEDGEEKPTRDYRFEIILGLMMVGMAAAMVLFSIFCAIPF